MYNVRDGTILLQVDVESLGLEILGDHAAGLNDASLLGEVTLGEGLHVMVSIR